MSENPNEQDLRFFNLSGQVSALKNTCVVIIAELPEDISEKIRAGFWKELKKLEELETTDPKGEAFLAGAVTAYRSIINRADFLADYLENP